MKNGTRDWVVSESFWQRPDGAKPSKIPCHWNECVCRRAIRKHSAPPNRVRQVQEDTKTFRAKEGHVMNEPG